MSYIIKHGTKLQSFNAMECGTTKEERTLKLQTKWIREDDLTSECLKIQVLGPQTCYSCEFRDKPQQCSGVNIRKMGMNRKGHEIPLKNMKPFG